MNQLAIIVTLACTCNPVLSQEPNEAKMELKFQRNSHEWIWRIDRAKIARGPIVPTHVAVFHVKWHHVQPDHLESPAILDTAAGQSLSKLQQDLVKSGTAVRMPDVQMEFYSDTFGGRRDYSQQYDLFAVSEEDAREMVRAFTEVLFKHSNVKLQPVLKNYIDGLTSKQQEYEEKIAEAEKEIPKKEAEVKKMRDELTEMKKTAHYLSVDEASQTIRNLNPMLDTLDIEIAGIRAKLEVIDMYIEEGKRNRAYTVGRTLEKLNQMATEQMIELRGAEARKQTASHIRERAEKFVALTQDLQRADMMKGSLATHLNDHKKKLLKLREKLANPTPEMLPPKVFQDKVTIYPVRVDN
jgi:hypothetical protein